jgi:hypothetical protein
MNNVPYVYYYFTMGKSLILTRTTHRDRYICRYPSTYIDAQFRTFFERHMSVRTTLLSSIDDAHDYLSLRTQLQQQPSVKQIIALKNAQKVRFETEILNDNTQRQKPHATTTDPTRKEKYTNTLIIHCRHEQRLVALKRDMHRIYESIFRGTPAMDIKLIVGHTNNRSAVRDLTRARPSMALLNPTKKPSENRINLCVFREHLSRRTKFCIPLRTEDTRCRHSQTT